MTKRKSSRTYASTCQHPGRGAEHESSGERRTAEPPQSSVERPPARKPTKQALILGLLQRQEGATLADLVAATGWLPHTTRAALTRLRQAGHVLDKIKGETGTVYRIATPARADRSRKAA